MTPSAETQTAKIRSNENALAKNGQRPSVPEAPIGFDACSFQPALDGALQYWHSAHSNKQNKGKPLSTQHATSSADTALQCRLPQILQIGAGVRFHLSQVLRQLRCQRPLIVCDPFLADNGVLASITDSLGSEHANCQVFTGVQPDPDTRVIGAGLAALQDGDHDCVVGLGGGSALDTAKAIAAMSGRPMPMDQYKVPYQIDSGLPMIAIPSTGGTGSEATRVAVITNADNAEKMLWMGDGLQPRAALVDYELSLSMPARLTADTGLDSFCHALEAFVSRKANAFTDPIALQSMKSIHQNLLHAYQEPDNREARAAMMLAATQGGIAFSNASVTLIHGMSRPIGAHFHVPHGLSNAMLLPVVTEWSSQAALPRYAVCARHLGLAMADSPDTVAVNALIDHLHHWCDSLDVPTPAQWGIAKSDWQGLLELMAQQALDSGSPANNPRIPEQADIVDLYERVYQA